MNALNALLALPAPLSGDVGIAIAGVVSGLVSVAAIVFALRPEARAYRRRGAERSSSPTR